MADTLISHKKFNRKYGKEKMLFQKPSFDLIV